MHKRYAVILTAALLAGAPAAAQSTIHLRFTTWAGGASLDLLKTIAAEYSASHKGIVVDVETVPFAGYDQKIAVQIAGGNAPDAGWLAERWVQGFIQSKALLDLKPVVGTDAHFGLNDFASSALALWARGEALYGVPFSFSPIVLFYNKDLFKKAGVLDPQVQVQRGRWTYTAFRQAAEAIAKANPGTYGASLFRLDPQAWAGAILPVMYAHGGDLFNKDLSSCTLGEPGAVQGWQLAQQLIASGASPKLGEQVTFASGRLGMYPDNVSYNGQLTQATFDWDIAPMPSGPSGRFTQLGQAGYVAFAGSKHPKEAGDFVKFMGSLTTMKRTAQFFPPPRKTLLNSSTFLNANPALKPASLRLAVINQVPNARTLIAPANWAQINDAVVNSLESILRPGSDVKQELTRVCQAINPLLKR
ncbi:MAG TPA: sugar ABC transporter substrate-binding protein [Deinococcales bacterium]|nr:sugar ABC transporter substrate-binding protein [Deinococcales bacterium]